MKYHIQVYLRETKSWVTWEKYEDKRDGLREIMKLMSASRLGLQFRLVKIEIEGVK